MNITFASSAPRECREQVEDLLFFNPRQQKVRKGIQDSVARFGLPRLVETPAGVSVRVGEHETQALFAFDRDRENRAPAGAVIFLRTLPEEITILHVAVEDEYALQGASEGSGLGVALVEKVKEIARRIAGVKRLTFFYRRQVVIRL
ncbi:MAG TPA: hypothetical protein VHH88_04160 [Verrucomicrobiae bacterium]|nr:hypothetical protein [Verrucomicrobiae bacterium]